MLASQEVADDGAQGHLRLWHRSKLGCFVNNRTFFSSSPSNSATALGSGWFKDFMPGVATFKGAGVVEAAAVLRLGRLTLMGWLPAGWIFVAGKVAARVGAC